jgi:hypothetical protein
MESLCKRSSVGLYVGRIVMVLSLLCAAALQPAAGQSFTVKDLGTLPHGAFSVARASTTTARSSEIRRPTGYLDPMLFSSKTGSWPTSAFSPVPTSAKLWASTSTARSPAFPAARPNSNLLF